MILVDTSAWVEFFRGDGSCCDAVDSALAQGEAALCGPVLTEIHRGLTRKKERHQVMEYLQGCQLLSQPTALWESAGALGSKLRAGGVTVKTLDLLIATYAVSHDLPILTSDSDFSLMQDAGVALVVLLN